MKYGYILVVGFALCSNSTFSQTKPNRPNQITEGEYSFCQGIGQLDTLGRPSLKGEYAGWKYMFYANGRFAATAFINNSAFESRGTWKQTATDLTLDVDDTPTLKRNPFTRPLFWLNSDLFYTLGQEGKNGPLVYDYYKRIKKNK